MSVSVSVSVSVCVCVCVCVYLCLCPQLPSLTPAPLSQTLSPHAHQALADVFENEDEHLKLEDLMDRYGMTQEKTEDQRTSEV